MATHLRNWELGTKYTPGVSKVLGATSGTIFIANANSSIIDLADTNPDNTSGKDNAHWLSISINNAGVLVERQTLFLYDSEANFDIDWPYDSNNAASTNRYTGMPVIFAGATAAAIPAIKVWDGGAFIDATYDVYVQSDTIIHTNMPESLTAEPFDAAVFGAIEFLVAQGKQGKQVKRIRSIENLNYVVGHVYEEPTMAALKARTDLIDGAMYHITSYRADGNGLGAGSYFYHQADTLGASSVLKTFSERLDDATYPDAILRRVIEDGVISPEFCAPGSIGDGIADDTAAIKRWIQHFGQQYAWGLPRSKFRALGIFRVTEPIAIPKKIDMDVVCRKLVYDGPDGTSYDPQDCNWILEIQDPNRWTQMDFAVELHADRLVTQSDGLALNRFTGGILVHSTNAQQTGYHDKVNFNIDSCARGFQIGISNEPIGAYKAATSIRDDCFENWQEFTYRVTSSGQCGIDAWTSDGSHVVSGDIIGYNPGGTSPDFGPMSQMLWVRRTGNVKFSDHKVLQNDLAVKQIRDLDMTTIAGDTFTHTAHGLVDDEIFHFPSFPFTSLVLPVGLDHVTYYNVINATANTFQIALYDETAETLGTVPITLAPGTGVGRISVVDNTCCGTRFSTGTPNVMNGNFEGSMGLAWLDDAIGFGRGGTTLSNFKSSETSRNVQNSTYSFQRYFAMNNCTGHHDIIADEAGNVTGAVFGSETARFRKTSGADADVVEYGTCDLGLGHESKALRRINTGLIIPSCVKSVDALGIQSDFNHAITGTETTYTDVIRIGLASPRTAGSIMGYSNTRIRLNIDVEGRLISRLLLDNGSDATLTSTTVGTLPADLPPYYPIWIRRSWTALGAITVEYSTDYVENESEVNEWVNMLNAVDTLGGTLRPDVATSKAFVIGRSAPGTVPTLDTEFYKFEARSGVTPISSVDVTNLPTLANILSPTGESWELGGELKIQRHVDYHPAVSTASSTGVEIAHQRLFLFDTVANADATFPPAIRYNGMSYIIRGATDVATPTILVWDGTTGQAPAIDHDVYKESAPIIYTNMEESEAASFLIAQDKLGKEVQKIGTGNTPTATEEYQLVIPFGAIIQPMTLHFNTSFGFDGNLTQLEFFTTEGTADITLRVWTGDTETGSGVNVGEAIALSASTSLQTVTLSTLNSFTATQRGELSVVNTSADFSGFTVKLRAIKS